MAQSQVDLHKQAIDVFLSLKRQEAEFRDAAGGERQTSKLGGYEGIRFGVLVRLSALGSFMLRASLGVEWLAAGFGFRDWILGFWI